MVLSRVEPPAPNVTEKNSGENFANSARVSRKLSMPSAVLGGKNSKLSVVVFIYFSFLSSIKIAANNQENKL